MWAAREVRARIVDIHREVDVPGHPPVATITLQPTSTWRVTGPASTFNSGSTSPAPSAPPGSSPFPAPTQGRASASPSRCARTTTAASQSLGTSSSRRRPARRAPVAGAGRVRPAGPDARAVDVHHRRIRHHAGDVDAAQSLQKRTHRGRITFLHYAQSPEHQIFADELADIRTHRIRRRRPPAPPGAGRPGADADVPGEARPRLPRRPDLGLRPGAAHRSRPGAYGGSDALQLEYFKPPKSADGEAGGRSRSPAPAARCRTPANPSWTRPRPLA